LAATELRQARGHSLGTPTANFACFTLFFAIKTSMEAPKNQFFGYNPASGLEFSFCIAGDDQNFPYISNP
jgi:hypothetical protein